MSDRLPAAPAAPWRGARLDLIERHVGVAGEAHLGPVEGVRCAVTGHTPATKPTTGPDGSNVTDMSPKT